MDIGIELNACNKIYKLQRQRRKTIKGKSGASTFSKKEYSEFANDLRNGVEDNSNLPIFLNYGTNRSVLQIPLRIRNKHEFTQYTALERAVENSIDFKSFFEWFRDQEDVENEYIRDHGEVNYRDRTLEYVRRSVEAMLDNVSGLRIKRKPLRMIVEKEGKELLVDNLSDGEKCTLAMFGDLARRLAIANPGLENPMHGEGIVLIDEIELHMHPTWQRKVLSTLKNTFPNIQFIITTHSPQVLGELNDEYLIFHMKNSDYDEVSVSRIIRLDGFDSNYILKNYMDTSPINAEFDRKVRKTYELIEQNNFDKASVEIEEIAKITELNHSEVIRLEGALKRGIYLHEKHNKE